MVKHPKFYRKSSVLYRFRFFDTLIQIFSGFCYVKHYTIFFVLCTEFFCVFIGCAGNIRQKHFDRSHQIMSHFSILSEFSLIFRNGHSERHAKKRNREFCFTQNQRLLLFFYLPCIAAYLSRSIPFTVSKKRSDDSRSSASAGEWIFSIFGPIEMISISGTFELIMPHSSPA